MTVFLSHETAFGLWRRIGTPRRAKTGYNPMMPVPKLRENACARYLTHVPELDAFARQELACLGIDGSSLHAMVPTPCARRNNGAVRCHVQGLAAQANSFFEITPRLYLAAPELVYLQLAGNRNLTMPQLVLIGCELCGTFARVPESLDGRRLCQREPLTTLARIEEYIGLVEERARNANAKVPGMQKARRALRYVIDGSASPMESILCALLCMPVEKGGYGLPRPKLNECMVNGRLVYRATGRHALISDLFWEKGKVDVEYDSDENHEESDQRYRDDEKRNALLDLGFTVFTANRLHVLDAGRTDVLAEQVTRALHCRVRTRISDVEARREVLRHELLTFEGLHEI